MNYFDERSVRSVSELVSQLSVIDFVDVIPMRGRVLRS